MEAVAPGRDGSRADAARRDANDGGGRARLYPAATPAAEPRASGWPFPEGKGDGEEESLELADMGKVNFHGKWRDALTFSSTLIFFFF